MPALSGPVMVAALLLVFAGAGKVRRPDNAAHALRTLGLPAAPTAVRLLALTEMAIGLAVVGFGTGVTALLLASSYLGFAGFVLLAMVRGGPLSSCGCFGTPDTPPTVTHVVVTLAAAGVALAAAAHPVGHLVDHLAGQPLLGFPFLALTGLSVWFAYTALAVLPGTAAYVRHRS